MWITCIGVRGNIYGDFGNSTNGRGNYEKMMTYPGIAEEQISPLTLKQPKMRGTRKVVIMTAMESRER